MQAQEPIDWYVPVEVLRNLCIDARGSFARDCKPLNDLLASQPADDPNGWGLDALPTHRQRKLPDMTNPSFWALCRQGVEELTQILAPPTVPSGERAFAGDVLTCWLRCHLLGHWLHEHDFELASRAHMVRRYIENHHSLHGAVMRLMGLQSDRHWEKNFAWMEDTTQPRPYTWPEACLDWLFEYLPGFTIDQAVSTAVRARPDIVMPYWCNSDGQYTCDSGLAALGLNGCKGAAT